MNDNKIVVPMGILSHTLAMQTLDFLSARIHL